MSRKGIAHIIKNEKGMLSADFLFSMIIGIMMCLVLFVMTSTFTLVEIGQYIAFSSARSMMAGNLYPGSGTCGSAGGAMTDQTSMACTKYDTLVNHPFVKNLLNNSWIRLQKDSDFMKIGTVESPDLYDGYEQAPRTDRIVQTGVRLAFSPIILQNLKISFLADPAENIQGEQIKSKITGLLVREPTSIECYSFMLKRYDAIYELDKRFSMEEKHNGQAKQHYDPGTTAEGLTTQLTKFSTEDNGC